MGRIGYDDEHAAAFAAGRRIADEGLTAWRSAIARHLRPTQTQGLRLLDLGAGTGAWAVAFAGWWPDVEIVAVEPSPAMRERCRWPGVLAGEAAAIPLPPCSVDVVWLSTVVHHIPDLTAAATEISRVLRPQGTVLLRSVFAGRHDGISLFRFWPEAVRVIDTYPSIAEVQAAFTDLRTVAVERVAQTTAPSLSDALATMSRAAHTPLALISDDEYDAGLARLRHAAGVEHGPVVDALDLLVLRREGRGS